MSQVDVLVVGGDQQQRNVVVGVINKGLNEAGFENVSVNKTNDNSGDFPKPAEVKTALDILKERAPGMFRDRVNINYGDLGLVPGDANYRSAELAVAEQAPQEPVPILPPITDDVIEKMHIANAGLGEPDLADDLGSEELPVEDDDADTDFDEPVPEDLAFDPE